MFIHLTTHSGYSFLEGLPAPSELARAAAENSMPALALCDHHHLTGLIEFYDACREQGIQPILGLTVDVATDFHQGASPLTVLAMDLAGWASLCRLSSAALTELPESAGRAVPFARFAQEANGLICLSGGRRGLLAQLLAAGKVMPAQRFIGALAEVFGDRLYLEVQRHTPEDDGWVARLASLAQALSLPLVATHGIYYLQPNQAALQRVTTAIRLNCRLNEIPPGESAPPNACFLSPQMMLNRFTDLPQACAATGEIASRCQLKLPLGTPHYPQVASGPDAEATTYRLLRQQAYQGAMARYGEITPQIRERLEQELATIEALGYGSLFLIMQEILQFARRQGIPFSSRGSAASSLVAHCLGITSPDPLRHNLYFERFLNPARATPPDIDTDLCSRRRDEVIRFVYERFGAERVAMVCTVNRFRRRSALREVAKAYGLPKSEINAMAAALPHRWYGPPALKSRTEAPYAALAEHYRSPLHQQILRDATALLGAPHHLSIHPGGVVISPGNLTDLAPTQLAAKGIVVTQFDLDSIERLGLVKIDLLGIRGLSVLGEVAQQLYAAAPANYSAPLDVLETIPDNNPATARLVSNGDTIGCFQIESPGMRATLREIGAKSVDDVMTALALYRPGPLTGGLKEAFVRRHRGEEQVQHLHPALAPLLDDTYGVILYQEQVLRIAHELAGLSLADSDLLRRAMSHFDPGKQMQTLRERFINGAISRAKMPVQAAERVWELMAAFAGYGFPKAHAASYALVSWRAAWCKAHHPEVFMTAVLANWGGYYGQRTYLLEARRLGLTVRPPHVNYSQGEFSLAYLEGQPVLFMGLNQVRELTRRTQERLIRQRPFHSLDDFLARVDPRPVEAENLIRVGALEGFGSIPTLLEQLKGRRPRGGQLSLFAAETPELEDWPITAKITAEQAILGTPVSLHPLELAANQIAAAGAISTLDAAGRLNQLVRVAGVRLGWRRGQTADGTVIYLTSLEDLTGSLEVAIPSTIYRRYQREFASATPLVIEGMVELNQVTAEPYIRAEKVWQLT